MIAPLVARSWLDALRSARRTEPILCAREDTIASVLIKRHPRYSSTTSVPALRAGRRLVRALDMLDPRGVTDPRVAVRGIGRATEERVEGMRVVNRTRQMVLATDVRQAANPWSRMTGLLGRATLGPGE